MKNSFLNVTGSSQYSCCTTYFQPLHSSFFAENVHFSLLVWHIKVRHCTGLVQNSAHDMTDKMNLLVHLMSHKFEVGYFCAVLNQPPHILSIGFINIIVHCFQVQAVHLQRVGNLQTDAQVNCSAEERRDEK